MTETISAPNAVRSTISAEEYAKRRESLRDAVGEGLIVLMRPLSILHFLGFHFSATERPLAVVLDGAWLGAVVPRLECEYLQDSAVTPVDDVRSYDDYPGLRHPMELVADLLRERGGAERRLVVDSDGYPGASGYRGPRISELLPGADVVACVEAIEGSRRVKSRAEIEILRTSARYSDLAHRRLQALCRDGANETEVSLQAEHEVMGEILADAGAGGYQSGHPWLTALITLRSQIGANAAYPHATNRNLTMRDGDVLVTAAMVYVEGYTVELERTMILGEPTIEQRRFFSLMLGAQETGRAALRPGARCGDVDRAVRDYFEQHDLTQFWRHHTGHGLGLEVHESPYLDVGDETVIEEGMVFSVEPGIYVPGLGGFRHSDTALVTADGAEFLGEYPRDLTSLTIAADPAAGSR